MQDWFFSLSMRERVMVAACAIFVVGAVVWSFGLQPLLKESVGLDDRVASKRNQLASMQEQAAMVDSAGGVSSARPSGANQSLVVIIDRTTRERQLAGYLKRNQPEGPASVRLRFEAAPFDDLIAWLGDLDKRFGLQATNASLDRAGSVRVKASVTVTRSNL